MNRLIFRVVLLSALSVPIFSVQANADIPLPSKVTDDIVEPKRTDLKGQRAILFVRRDTLKARVAAHNAKCRNIAADSDIAAECRQNQGLLQAEVITYTSDVRAFNKVVMDAPRVIADPSSEPALWLSNNMIKYFLINRDENYTFHDAIMRDMIDESSAGQKWPGPKRRYGRLANPLDETQVQRDRELLRPLDHDKIRDLLTLEQAAHIVNERQHAREREATRRASNRMHEAMRKLEDEGLLALGESVLDKEKNDPGFRKRLKGILSDITKDEIADVHKARSLALKEIGEIIETRAIGPEKKQRFHKIQQEIYKRRDSDLGKINNQALKEMWDEMEQLKQEGFYSEGDDLVEKDRNNPHFKNAVNKAVQKVLLHQYEAECRVQQKTLEDLRSAYNKLRDGSKADSNLTIDIQ